MKELVLAGILLLSLPLSGCMEQAGQAQAFMEEGETVQLGCLTTENTVGDVVSHLAFAGFGQFILPTEWGYDEDMPLSEIASLLPYHSHIDSERAVETINHMAELAEEQDIFYWIYPEAVWEAEREKENAGLFFFRGGAGRALCGHLPRRRVFLCRRNP